ncbi:MAG: sugar phosphate isomerase, partial [Paenibacillaceae bacterium]|nr:sugar phosphate isomerase [Paenibacillaceae bacterium]
ITSGEMDILQAIEWVAKIGGEHVEIVPRGFDLIETPELADRIREKAAECGLFISNYPIGANFIKPDEESYRDEIEKVKQHVDIARRLGSKHMRHDVANRPIPETTIGQFEQDLPKLVQACQEIADYAAQYGITTSVENHGHFLQKSDRVQRLVTQVNRPNFRTLLDIGNFLVVDENPVAAVKNNLPYASMVHLKDFFYRAPHRKPGEMWRTTPNGFFWRGAIVGHGDIDMYEVIRAIKTSGYDGNISIEFEGAEECKLGTRIGFENARRIWNEV